MMQRALLLRSLHLAAFRPATASRTLNALTTPSQPPSTRAASHSTAHLLSPSSQSITYSNNKSAADQIIEEITELYATAQDEFEIAMEETEKMSVYAEEDRKAAREELERVQEAYRKVVEGEDGGVAEEVRRRVGQRIRELEQGVRGMEEMAQNQD
ncbi:hypothetical protein B0A55_05919 [Friedmanniomyces simplex]|uniref:Uncharacterized protein n=1 Tax=Friedmanniomyces simplex TaxID=329884 RepID=A0A4U0XFI1_9PEZI|nr:hypothetical protein B0A55_05919 [Friedmanniomyces simplex]